MKCKDTGTSPENGFVAAMEMIKSFCILHNIHGIVVSQINKDASAAAKKGHFIGAEDAGWINPNMANFALSLNVRRDEVGGVQMLPQVATGAVAGVVRVLKNSAGESTDVNLVYVPHAYQWRDEDYQFKTIDLSE
jgi:hypothetical protein